MPVSEQRSLSVVVVPADGGNQLLCKRSLETKDGVFLLSLRFGFKHENTWKNRAPGLE